MVAAIPLLIGILVSLLVRDIPIVGRALIAVMPAVITFIAATLLFATDALKHQSHMAAVRKTLRARSPVRDEDFCQYFPEVDAKMLRLTREGIAQFFDVPAETIHPSDELESDLHFSSLEPAFHSFVTYFVLAECCAIEASFTFRSSRMSDVGSLAKEISRIHQRLQYVADGEDKSGGQPQGPDVSFHE